jgi:hypothetical protein
MSCVLPCSKGLFALWTGPVWRRQLSQAGLDEAALVVLPRPGSQPSAIIPPFLNIYYV